MGRMRASPPPRFALLSHLPSRLRDCCGGAPPEGLQCTLAEARATLREESWGDAAVRLERMSLQDRQGLLRLATHGAAPTAHPLSDSAGPRTSMDMAGVLKLMAEAKERELAQIAGAKERELALIAEAHAARERALQGELEAAKREAAVREEAGAAGGGPAPLRQRLPGGSWRWSSARAP